MIRVRLLTLAGMLLAASVAIAQTPIVCPNAPATCPSGAACLSWTPPTTYTDGSPLVLKGYQVSYGTDPVNLSLTRAFNVGSQSACYVNVTNLAPATYYFCLKTVSDKDELSLCSNSVTKTVTAAPAPLPNPPTNLTVGSAPAEVFQVVGTTDQFQLLPVGTVPASTQCILTQQVNGRYAVPRELVSWYGNVKPRVVVAECN